MGVDVEEEARCGLPPAKVTLLLILLLFFGGLVPPASPSAPASAPPDSVTPPPSPLFSSPFPDVHAPPRVFHPLA